MNSRSLVDLPTKKCVCDKLPQHDKWSSFPRKVVVEQNWRMKSALERYTRNFLEEVYNVFVFSSFNRKISVTKCPISVLFSLCIWENGYVCFCSHRKTFLMKMVLECYATPTDPNTLEMVNN